MFFKKHKNKLQYLHRIQNNKITIINYMTLSLGIQIDGQLNWKEQIDEILLYRTGNAIIITVCYVFRCHAVIAANKQHLIDPSVDGGKWCDIVQKGVNVNLHRNVIPPPLPTAGWQKFPGASVPETFNKGHVYHYLVEMLQTSDDVDDDSDIDTDSTADTFTSKPLHRGELCYTSGHVTQLQDIRCGSEYFVKAEVFASMKRVAYSVTATLSMNSGFILNATCQCKCAVLGRCSHVGGLLHAVLDHASHADSACTSQLCQWNVGKRKGKQPQSLTDVSYSGDAKMKRRQIDGVSKFDPRPPSLCTTEPNIANEFVRDLQSIPSTCPSSWETMLPIIYEDFILTEVEANMVKDQVNSMCSQLTHPSLAPILLTSEQGSARWKNERRVRLTASNAKAICVAKSDERRGNLVRGQLWGATVSTPAMKYGVKNEPVARETFATTFINKGTSCVDTGMWVNGRYPDIGASPDGLLFDTHTNSWGVLEIKCPKSLQSVAPCEFADHLSAKQVKAFCLQKTPNGQCLKTNHAYYYQMQLQMGVCVKFSVVTLWFGPHSGFTVNTFYLMLPFFQSLLQS